MDCGCGAGSDIAYLRRHGFRVYAFDIEPEAIARCEARFGDDSEVVLEQASFSDFRFPPASLIVADASLFFCAEKDFCSVWQELSTALLPGGIFAGSFLGPEDDMAQPDCDGVRFWPTVSVLDERRVRSLFRAFDILTFAEHKTAGNLASNRHATAWHIFSVVARKR